MRKSKFRGYRQRVSPKDCSGKCCFHCGKEGHFGLFCSTSATVQELVSCAEAYRASRTEVDLISDKEEAAAVTIAYARNSKPGVMFKQWTKTAADKEPEASIGTEDGRGPHAAMRKSKFRGYRQRVSPKDCSGKCCFRCVKEGHFA